MIYQNRKIRCIKKGQNKLKINYQLELDKELEKIRKSNSTPKLMLHSCCAPCSSYVLEYLSRFFEITVYYYNPNIFPEDEFIKRLNEQIKLIKKMSFENKVSIINDGFLSEEYHAAVLGLENEKEGGARCAACFRLRLEKTAQKAVENGYDYFTTTLTISPHKNAQVLNCIGGETGEKYGIKYLFSDFKKREGYKRSIQLSEEYGLYRQDYCGCEYSNPLYAAEK